MTPSFLRERSTRLRPLHRILRSRGDSFKTPAPPRSLEAVLDPLHKCLLPFVPLDLHYLLDFLALRLPAALVKYAFGDLALAVAIEGDAGIDNAQE